GGDEYETGGDEVVSWMVLMMTATVDGGCEGEEGGL
nr:hypothetical protein [Tanacetum cinerariifolium]